jgi:hypothetical protein
MVILGVASIFIILVIDIPVVIVAVVGVAVATIILLLQRPTLSSSSSRHDLVARHDRHVHLHALCGEGANDLLRDGVDKEQSADGCSRVQHLRRSGSSAVVAVQDDALRLDHEDWYLYRSVVVCKRTRVLERGVTLPAGMNAMEKE